MIVILKSTGERAFTFDVFMTPTVVICQKTKMICQLFTFVLTSYFFKINFVSFVLIYELKMCLSIYRIESSGLKLFLFLSIYQIDLNLLKLFQSRILNFDG